MNILVACEESQRVCTAFRAKGHNAFSCDILPCSGGHPESEIYYYKAKNGAIKSDSQWRNGISAKERSKTFQGVAFAMAEQWG
jgi:hypothetical protein